MLRPSSTPNWMFRSPKTVDKLRSPDKVQMTPNGVQLIPNGVFGTLNWSFWSADDSEPTPNQLHLSFCSCLNSKNSNSDFLESESESSDSESKFLESE